MGVDFPPEQCEAAEGAFQNDLEDVAILGAAGRVTLALDFLNMAQTGKVARSIRRVVVLKGKK